MKKNLKKLLYLIILISTQIKAQSYFPLDVGNVWYFESTGIQKITGKKLLKGKEYYVYEKWNYEYFYRYDEEGNIVQRDEKSEYVWINFNVGVGNNYSFQRELNNGYLETTNVVLISNSDTVNTTDTAFTNCLHFYFDVLTSIDEEYSIWLAPGVGVVKWINHAWGGYQLTKAKINGNKIPQVSQPLRVVSTIPFNHSNLVPIDTKIKMVFNFVVRLEMLNKNNFKILSKRDGETPFNIQSEYGTNIYLYPVTNFSYDDTITISISDSIKDYTGDNVPKDFVFAFHTEPEIPELAFFEKDNISEFLQLQYGDFDIGDFDNDGDRDILFMGKNDSENARYSKLKLYENKNGIFSESAAQFCDMVNFGNDFIKFVDFNKDGFLDIVYNGCPPGGSSKTLFYQNTNLQFVEKPELSIPFGSASMQWFDYNNDGFKDLAIQGNYNGNYGEYTAGIILYDNLNGKLVLNSILSSPEPNSSIIFRWMDFNFDNKIDIASYDYCTNTFSIIENLGNRFCTHNSQIKNLKLIQDRFNMDYSDYDKDGDIDFIISSVLINSEGNCFNKVEGKINEIDNAFVKFEDINDDGYIDLYLFGSKSLTLEKTSHFIQLYLNVSGIFKLWKEMKINDIKRTYSARWEDINRDGKTDLIIDSYSGLEIFYNTLNFTNIKESKQTKIYSYNLSQNFPNPFNPETKIKYTIPAVERSGASLTRLIVYDILGNKIATLVNEEQFSGEYEVEFDGSKFSSGIYFYVLNYGTKILSKKMILLK